MGKALCPRRRDRGGGAEAELGGRRRSQVRTGSRGGAGPWSSLWPEPRHPEAQLVSVGKEVTDLGARPLSLPVDRPVPPGSWALERKGAWRALEADEGDGSHTGLS